MELITKKDALLREVNALPVSPNLHGRVSDYLHTAREHPELVQEWKQYQEYRHGKAQTTLVALGSFLISTIGLVIFYGLKSRDK